MISVLRVAETRLEVPKVLRALSIQWLDLAKIKAYPITKPDLLLIVTRPVSYIQTHG